jgi:hypothetical protein
MFLSDLFWKLSVTFVSESFPMILPPASEIDSQCNTDSVFDVSVSLAFEQVLIESLLLNGSPFNILLESINSL